MHILLEEKKLNPLIAIEQISKFFTNYKYLDFKDGSGSNSVLIDEKLFRYIVEKYDGLSRMMELSTTTEDRSGCISRHIIELKLRFVNVLSNKNLSNSWKESKKAKKALPQHNAPASWWSQQTYQKWGLDVCSWPTQNFGNIVSDKNIGVLTSVSLHTIENCSYGIDYTTVESLLCGANKYFGKMMAMATREQIEVMLYPADILQYVSLNGKSFKAHLALELRVHQ